MAYNVSAAFREQCYSGESLYSCRLIIGENTIPISQIASITISSPIIDSNSETFYIGTFISQQLTIEFKNLDGIDTASGTNVELYISQNVGGTDIEVPIGKYVIDESPENYYQSAKIVCLDYAIKFATNLDYSSALVDNKITIDNLLQWICNHYGITLGSYPSINGNVEIGTYDSTVSGKRWISYIAEIKGCNAKMDRLGQLTLVPIKSSPAVTINALKSASWKLGEKFEISQVTFFDAIRNYTYGDDSENTLFLRQDNPFIIDTNVVQNVYNAVKDLQIWSLKCDNYGDISLDAWDIIQYTLGNETYYTYNNNTITYAMTIMSKVETKIPTKQQEVTTNVLGGDEQQQIRRLKTEVNTLDNEITIAAQQIETIEQDIQNPTSTKENKYFDIEDALDQPLQDFSLYGETQQDSTTGKNLLKNYATDTSSNGIAYRIDKYGGIYANGTATALSFILLQTQQQSQLYEAGTYTFSLLNNMPTNGNVRFEFFKSDKTTMIVRDNITEGNKTFIANLNEDGYLRVSYMFYNNAKPNNFYNIVQVEKGNTASQIEPYTGGYASPSPNWEQPIHNVSGDNTIEICGKNLFDKTTIIEGKYIDGSGNLVNDTGAFVGDYIKIDNTNQYYVSSGVSSTKRIVYYNSSKTFISRQLISTIGSILTIPNNTQYVRLSCNNDNLDTLQLEKGSTATTYEAYTGNSQLISLGVENLFDKDNANILNANLADSGTLSQTNNARTLYIPCKNNTTYTISKLQAVYFRVAEFTNTPTIGSSYINRIKNDSANYITFTTTTGNYLAVTYWYSSSTNTEQQVLDSIQIEKGSKANSYSPYGANYIELNKTENQDHTIKYQDYIYPSNDRWFLHKETGKKLYSSCVSAGSGAGGSAAYMISFSTISDMLTQNWGYGYSNYFLRGTDKINNVIRFGANDKQIYVYSDDDRYQDKASADSWLSSNTLCVSYILSTPTDTEITSTNYPVLYEQLQNLMALPLYKNMTHITLTPNDLQPTMNIEYYRNTSINNNYLPREEITKYYTKVETNAQIQISSSDIMSEVSRVEEKTDANNKYTSRVETSVTNLQTDTRTLLTFKQNVEQNGVETLKNTLIQADINGLSITKGEQFKNLNTDRNVQIISNGKEISFMGYDDNLKKTVARIDELESERATIGVHRTEVLIRNGKKRTAGFYIGGGN